MTDPTFSTVSFAYYYSILSGLDRGYEARFEMDIVIGSFLSSAATLFFDVLVSYVDLNNSSICCKISYY